MTLQASQFIINVKNHRENYECQDVKLRFLHIYTHTHIANNNQQCHKWMSSFIHSAVGKKWLEEMESISNILEHHIDRIALFISLYNTVHMYKVIRIMCNILHNTVSCAHECISHYFLAFLDVLGNLAKWLQLSTICRGVSLFAKQQLDKVHSCKSWVWVL